MAERSTRWAELIPVLQAALVLGGCPVEDNPAPPRIAISPTEGVAGTTFPVHVRGSNTRFARDTFAARLAGRGARVESFTVSSETAARLEVTIDDAAAAGARTLRIDAPPDTFTAAIEVRVPGQVPSVGIDPGLGGPGADIDLTLSGTATHFERGVTSMLFPEYSGVQVLSLDVLGPTLARARIRIAEAPTEGIHAAVIVTRDEIVTAPFQVVTETQPSLSVEPPEGFEGSDVDVVVTGSRADFGVAGDRVVLAFDPGAGIRVSNVLVQTRTRLTARFSIAANARAGYQRFTVHVDPADPDESARELKGSFSVRAPGSSSVRILPPAIRQGQTATLWLEGRGTRFSDAIGVRPEAGAGVDVTGVWVLGPEQAAFRLRADPDALLGTRTVEVDDGTTDELIATIEVLPPDPTVLEASPQFVQAGGAEVGIALTSPAGGLDGVRTRATAANRSGIAIRSLSVADASNATVVIDAQQSAPVGRTFLELRTGAVTSRAAVTTVAGEGAGSITIDPPVVRAGLGAVDIVVTAHDAPLRASSIVEVSDPAIGIRAMAIDEQSGVAHLTVDVARTATPGIAALVFADGGQRLAAPIEILPLHVPTVSSAPSHLTAGRTGQLVVAFGTGTTWLPGVTVAAAPLARGLSVDGLTVVNETTAVLEVTASSEATIGSTGIVLATHGEVAAVPLSVRAPLQVPSITLDPPSLEPGAIAAVTARVEGGSLAGDVRVALPQSPEVTIVGMSVLDAETVVLDLEVDPAASPGTRPVQVEAPGVVARAGLAIRSAGQPAVWIDDPRVRRGTLTRLEARVDGMDLAAGAVATADDPGVLVGEVRVTESTGHATVDVTVVPEATIAAFWLRIAASDLEVAHRILVGPAVASATSESTVEPGTFASEAVVAGVQTSFDPQESIVLPGRDSSGLLLGAPLVSSPGQLRLAVDTSARVTADDVQIVVVTGSEIVAVDLAVRPAPLAVFEIPGEVNGSVLSDLGAILEYDGASGGLQRLSVRPDDDATDLSLSLFGPDGLRPVVPTLRGTSPVVFPVPTGALARVAFVGEPGEGDESFGFAFEATPLVEDAVSELEPNDDLAEAELIPDPVTSPTVMTCDLGPTADRDVFVVTASTPVVFETFAQRIIAGPAAPDMAMRAPLDAALIAPALDADLVAVLDPSGHTQSIDLGLEGLAGATGSYLAVARSALVVNEIGWTVDGGYVELRAAPGLALDGFALRVLNARGQPILAEIDLAGAAAGPQGILLVSPTDLADVLVQDLDLPDDGAVTVVWDGVVVDAVAFGAAIRMEGEPVDSVGASAVGRSFGIDRNDNAADFQSVPPSPGTANR